MIDCASYWALDRVDHIAAEDAGEGHKGIDDLELGRDY